MCELDLEAWKGSSESWPRARKQHRCDCCGGFIQPGERYRRQFFIYEGTADSEKMCAFCEVALDAFAHVHGQWTSPSYFQELLRGCLEGASRGDLSDTDRAWRNALAGMIRRKRAAKRETVAHG